MTAMVPRFYAPLLDPDAGEVVLPPDESSHLVRVLRLGAGAHVRVFDGRGHDREAVVAGVEKSAVRLSLGRAARAAPEAVVAVTLGQALLKGDKFDAVVRDATMLGVTAVRPVLARRSDVPPAAARRGGRLDRWQRVAVSSAKQCGRAVVPDVLPAADLAACLAADTSALRLLLAEPSIDDGLAPLAGGRQGTVLDSEGSPAPTSVFVLVGPEGGWSDEELAVARTFGCRRLTLGGRTLRADAAALVALSVLFHALGEFAV